MANEFHSDDDCQRLREVYARTKGAVADDLEDEDEIGVDPELLDTHINVERALAFSSCGVPANIEGKGGEPDCDELEEWHETLNGLKLDQSDYIFRDDIAFDKTSYEENKRYHFNRAATNAQVKIEEQMTERSCGEVPTEKETPMPPITVECTAMPDGDRQDCLEKYTAREGASYGHIRE
jgi:hypothetical protein